MRLKYKSYSNVMSSIPELINSLEEALGGIIRILKEHDYGPLGHREDFCDLCDLFTRVDYISHLITKIIKSGKHKLKKNEVRKLTQLTKEKISNDFMILLITQTLAQIKYYQEIEGIIAFVSSISRFIDNSLIIYDIKRFYEKR